MYNDFYIDLFTEDENTFDLEKEYQIFIEGVNKWIKKAEQKSGVELPSSVKKGVAAVGRHYKHKLVGFEALGGDTEDREEFKDNKKKFNKRVAKAYIKHQVYKRSQNPEYQAKANEQLSKFDNLQAEYEEAKKKNAEKEERRRGQLNGTVANPNNLSRKTIKKKLVRHTGKENQDNKQEEKLERLKKKVI